MSPRRKPSSKASSLPTVLVLGRSRGRVSAIQRALERYGVRTSVLGWRASSSGLWRLGARAPQAIVLDVPPPVQADHVEFLQKLRDRWEQVPQVVVTRGASPSALTSLLAVGVDDFVSGDSGWVELVVRVRRQLRRVSALMPPAEGPETMRLDPARRVVTANGRRVALTTRECEVLRCLVERGGAVLTREEILEIVWDNAAARPTSPGIVGVYVLYLRRKLGKLGLAHALRTVKGEGYSFQAPGGYWAPGTVSALPGRGTDARDADPAIAARDGDVDVAAEAKQNPEQPVRREAL
ncbi:MAG: winged-helix domain-containing protein [Gemmatimonadota bacterium]|nr:winged-helix domain-containing protein [Gemmatimonadota bacterium]